LDSQQQFQNALMQFVNTLITEPKARRVRGTTPLFASGLIDSLKVLDLISFVESTLGIRIPDHKITLDNFRTIKAISKAFCGDGNGKA
jgi:acyl carrier protein